MGSDNKTIRKNANHINNAREWEKAILDVNTAYEDLNIALNERIFIESFFKQPAKHDQYPDEAENS